MVNVCHLRERNNYDIENVGIVLGSIMTCLCVEHIFIFQNIGRFGMIYKRKIYLFTIKTFNSQVALRQDARLHTIACQMENMLLFNVKETCSQDGKYLDHKRILLLLQMLKFVCYCVCYLFKYKTTGPIAMKPGM